MHLDELLQSLGQKLQLDGLQLNAQGVCRVVLDETLEINIEHAPMDAAVHLYSILGKAPDRDREGFFTRLLEAQHFAREIGEGCAFGYDSETGDVMLHRQMSTEFLAEEILEQALNEFANWAEHWQKKLSGMDPTDDGEADSSALEDMSSTMFIRG
jgi:hypothetical protein